MFIVKELKYHNTFKLFALFLLVSGSLICKDKATEKHFLWEVKSDKATVFLLGSVHLASEEIYPLADVIMKSYSKSHNVVFEVDMNDINPMEFLKKAFYQDDKTLEKSVKPETYKKLKESFSKFNMKESEYEKMKPWFAAMTLTNLEQSKNGFKAQFGIDMFFMKKAKDDRKKVLQLESAEMQINLLDEGLGDMQDEFVEYTLNDMDTTVSNQMNNLLEIWRMGDADKMDAFVNDEAAKVKDSDKFYNKFLYERNDRMTEKIVNYLKDNKVYFVVVGSAHLVGKRGIIKQLENLNFKVNQK